MELQRHLKVVHDAGMGLAGISYDGASTLADFSARRGITFPLLSDVGSKTIKRYGLLNTAVEPGNALYGYAFPGTFIVDGRAIVTARYFEDAYQERDTLSSILVRSGGHVDVPATKITGAHVSVTSYATDQTVAPGAHFSLVLDVTLGPRVHVYGRTASNYKPVEIRVEPQPGLRLKPAQYPTPEDYFFKPLKEHVPVYQHPFRIVQDVTVDPSSAGAAASKGVTRLTITGRFDYQACDETTCFVPQSVPLSWSVGLIPLDREPPKRH